jgi:hypothetical protein
MAGNPNPSFSLIVNNQGIAPAPLGGGDVPLKIGWTQSGAYSGSPGVGLYSATTVPALTAALGSYGNAVDAASLDLSRGASEVLVYKAFSGSLGSSTHTGSGTGAIAQSGQPVAPYGSGQNGSGILVAIVTGSTTSTTYGTFHYSIDGGNTFSAPIANPGNAGTYTIPGTGVTLTFTGAETTGVWVAADTYVNAITTAVGKMWPYGSSSFSILQTTATGSLSVIGEGTFTNNSGAPVDNFQVLIQIVTTGTLAAETAQYIYSLDGGITYSGVQTLIAATVTLPGGVVLTASDTGGSGGSQAGFSVGELYSFSTLGPQLVAQDVTNILNNLQGNPATWGWVHITQQANTVNTSASSGFELSTLFTDVSTAAGLWFAANQYVGTYFLIDSPPDDPLRQGGVNIDSTLETWALTASSDYISVGLGNAAATGSAANGWQLPRGSCWSLSARLATTPLGTDPAWVATGPLGGISKIYRNEATTPGLGPAGFVPLWTFNGQNGFFITNANILCSNVSDISLSQYRRVLNAACAATYAELITNLSGYVRTVGGQIDPRDVINIQNKCQAAALAAINGQCQTVICTLSPTIGAGGAISMQTGILPFAYVKAITETIGFLNPALAAAAS